MATNSKTSVSAEQAKLQSLPDGLSRSTSSLFNRLVVLGVATAKADIVANLRSSIALFTAIITAKQAYSVALTARKAVEAAMNAYYASIVAAVKQIAGPDNPALLTSVGITPPKARSAPTVETKAIAQANSEATRKARGTMSTRQRQTITSTPAPVLPVVGLLSATVPAAPTSTPAAPTSTLAAPASTPAAPATPVAAPGSSQGPAAS